MSHLADTQSNPSDTIRPEKMKPHEYWNKFQRREGEAVVTEEEFKKMGMAAQLRLFPLDEIPKDVLQKAADQKLLKEMKDYATINSGKSD